MYRPAVFAVDEISKLHAFIRERAFATLVCVKGGRAELAYAPVVLDADKGTCGSIRFHLARVNSIVEGIEGTQFCASFLGPDAYVSPDWYETPEKVPTWNYMGVEGRGRARKLSSDELLQLLVDLSEIHEIKLLPKKPWTIDKVPAGKMDMLLGSIIGVEIEFESLVGKFKLSQNTTAADIEGVINGLDTRGDASSIAVARAMRNPTAI